MSKLKKAVEELGCLDKCSIRAGRGDIIEVDPVVLTQLREAIAEGDA